MGFRIIRIIVYWGPSIWGNYSFFNDELVQEDDFERNSACASLHRRASGGFFGLSMMVIWCAKVVR